jgi:hypothetical protein
MEYALKGRPPPTDVLELEDPRLRWPDFGPWRQPILPPAPADELERAFLWEPIRQHWRACDYDLDELGRLEALGDR